MVRAVTLLRSTPFSRPNVGLRETMEQMEARDRPGEGTNLATVRREGIEAENKDWYSPDELWQWLGLGRTKIYELLRSGEIPSYKIGRVRRIRRRDLEAWLERNRCQSAHE